MSSFRLLPAVFLLALIASCGQQRNAVVGEGMFQKRKYLSGWHVDIGRRSTAQHRERAMHTSVLSRETELRTAQGSSIEEDLSELGEVFHSDEPMAGIVALVTPTPPRKVGQKPPTLHAGTPAMQDRDPDNIMPRKRFNALAIPALLFVLAGVVLAFVTNSGWLVAGALVIGLVLAAISLRRIRSREQSGKGFPLVALILGTMAALITAMVIIRTGF